VIGRVTVFSDPRIVKLLQTRFVPVAIDQANERRQQDAEGEFYRKIASQGSRKDFNQTTQGFYIATPGGNLLFYGNTHSADLIYRKLVDAMNEFDLQLARGTDFAPIDDDNSKDRWNISQPEDVAVVRVQAQVLDGYEEVDSEHRTIQQESISRDNLWITNDEIRQLAEDAIPLKLRDRIIRFHLVDNTRGEPPRWAPGEIRKCDLTLNDGVLNGEIHLETADGSRGYQVKIRGMFEAENDELNRFDLLAFGQHWGCGRYNRHAPEGKFPLVVAFSLADGSDIADSLAPWAARGWLDGYMNPQ